MLTVTEAASRYLCHMLDESAAPDRAAVRLLLAPEGLCMTIDRERDGDEHFERDGRTLLVLDHEDAAALSQRTLDVEGQGQRLVCKR
ncbi:MAG: hypothetical protein HZC37_17905 [Burkholderiales bacterium]|nr:hypothetical protein [Burkholderiales bacterium]